MSFLTRVNNLTLKYATSPLFFRSLSITKQLNIKEIKESLNGSTLVVEAVNTKSPNADLLVRAEKVPQMVPPPDGESQCYMCALDLDVKHTDVLILSQFVRSDGCMLPRRITGLCRRQQKKMGTMVTMAQKAGLMINLTPSYCKKDPKKRREWKKFNTYFDESTIFLKMKDIPKPWDRFKR